MNLTGRPLIIVFAILAILSALIYTFTNKQREKSSKNLHIESTNSSAGLQIIPSQPKNTDQERIIQDWVDSNTGQKLTLTPKGDLSLLSSNSFTLWTTNVLYLWLIRSTNHDYVIGTNGVDGVGFLATGLKCL
jgi:hypothetical protein